MSKIKTVEFQIKKNIGIIILKNEKKLNAWDYDMRSTIIKIFNKQKNVLGMMPHPERMVDKCLSGDDGSLFFKNLIKNIK